MDLLIKSVSQPETLRSQCLVAPVFAKGTLSTAAQQLDKTADQQISKLCKRGDIEGNVGDALLLPHIDGIKAERILLVGAGEKTELSEKDFQKLADKTLGQLAELQLKDACLLFDEVQVTDQDSAWQAKKLAQIAGLNSYRYSQTLSDPKAASTLKKLTLAGKTSAANKTAALEGKSIAIGMNIARELGNLPANICTPSHLAKQAKALARKHKTLSTSIVEEKKMRELGMGALLSVTAGTAEPAKLIVMNYQGGKKTDKPHALVGKGITFDSGGISLKPGAKMDEMKYDMCGAARSLPLRKTCHQAKQPSLVMLSPVCQAKRLKYLTPTPKVAWYCVMPSPMPSVSSHSRLSTLPPLPGPVWSLLALMRQAFTAMKMILPRS
jgi:leucyl aminopeptidase